MSDIYRSYYFEKVVYSELLFLSLKSSSPGQFFWELQLMQMSLNFQTYCCNIKIRGLGAKLSVDF